MRQQQKWSFQVPRLLLRKVYMLGWRIHRQQVLDHSHLQPAEPRQAQVSKKWLCIQSKWLEAQHFLLPPHIPSITSMRVQELEQLIMIMPQLSEAESIRFKNTRICISRYWIQNAGETMDLYKTLRVTFQEKIMLDIPNSRWEEHIACKSMKENKGMKKVTQNIWECNPFFRFTVRILKTPLNSNLSNNMLNSLRKCRTDTKINLKISK